MAFSDPMASRGTEGRRRDMAREDRGCHCRAGRRFSDSGDRLGVSAGVREARAIIARTGQIWVQRHTSAVLAGPEPKDIVAAGVPRANPWREPPLFDVC